MQNPSLDNFQDYFEILGINKDASLEFIRKAYRKQAKIYHPDSNPEVKSTAHFQLVREAYEVLSNPSRRQAYLSLYQMMKIRKQREEERQIVQSRRILKRLLIYHHESENLQEVQDNLYKFSQVMARQWSHHQSDPLKPEFIVDSENNFSGLDNLIQEMWDARDSNAHISGFEYNADLIFPSLNDLGANAVDSYRRVKLLLNDRQRSEDSYLIGHALYCVDLSKVLWPEDQFHEIASFLMEIEKFFDKKMEEWEIELDQKDSRLDTIVAIRRMIRAGLTRDWIERAIPYKIKPAEMAPLLKQLGI